MLRVVIIGSGNVATHLGRGLQQAGLHVVAVMSRNIEHARRLADSLTDCRATDSVADLPAEADLYLIATSDGAVAEVAATMPRVNGIVAHTSGSVPIDVLRPASGRTAVLYPLQTFSREAEIDLSKVPFFTEASDAATLDAIDSIGRRLSTKVAHADSEHRTTLHIAGVLSCNFVNYLWRLAGETLAKDGYSFDVLEPLITATLRKACEIGPAAAQTGPAARGDRRTIERHISLLPPDTARLYGELSEAIIVSNRTNL